MTAAPRRRRPAGTPLGAPFRRLWSASTVSNLADGVLKVALPLVAVRYTDSPALVAGLTFALTLPWLLFALPAGALADRLDRRHAMIGANVARALLVVALAVVALVPDAGSIVALYVVAFGVGVTETLYDTSAQSILPQVVPRTALPRANGRLYAAELTANQFVGPPLGGLLVAAGAAVAFGLPGALWALAVGLLVGMPGSYRPERTTRTTLRADIAEGLRFLWHDRLLRTLALMVGGSNFASNAAFAIFVLYAVGPDSPLGLSEPAYGVLLTATAVGAFAGSFVAERVVALVGRARSLTLTVLGTTALIGVPAVTTSPWVIGAVYAVGGAGIAVWNVVTLSLRQRITPDALLGRLNSCYRLVAWGTMPLGAAVGGLLGETFGLRTVFVVMAAVSAATLLGLLVVDDRSMDAAERAADEQDRVGVRTEDGAEATPADPEG
ncbi:MFS transporter [Cellulosimicrobium protaetiae]|uniref:MFS transporter n=1 Tax=Cellulosimicrobium protaetiae TaxID=2587808 RepID=A0A6M5UJZ7_9MICO|nr:MFS transporter [Cellulosimicrobium protaetiae]QJW37675.1 MFS transporter [Cellulosimicrobium protaetiae]